MKLWVNAGEPSCFPTPLLDCLPSAGLRYSTSRIRRKKRTDVKVFWPPIFSGGTTPSFVRQVVSAIWQKFGRVQFADLCLRSLAMNEAECGIYRGWVKTTVQF